jgi:hypothetical protein
MTIQQETRKVMVLRDWSLEVLKFKSLFGAQARERISAPRSGGADSFNLYSSHVL